MGPVKKKPEEDEADRLLKKNNYSDLLKQRINALSLGDGPYLRVVIMRPGAGKLMLHDL